MVAGYGHTELYPSLVSYETEGSVLGVFKIKQVRDCAISSEKPLAFQTRVLLTFSEVFYKPRLKSLLRRFALIEGELLQFPLKMS